MKEQIEKLLKERIISDKAFAKKLIADPNKTMHQFAKDVTTHLKLSPGQLKHLAETKFKVYVEPKNEYMIVIPALYLEDTAMSDEDLRKVAGGDCKWICACTHLTK